VGFGSARRLAVDGLARWQWVVFDLELVPNIEGRRCGYASFSSDFSRRSVGPHAPELACPQPTFGTVDWSPAAIPAETALSLKVVTHRTPSDRGDCSGREPYYGSHHAV